MENENLYLRLATVARYQDKYILTAFKINAIFIYDLKSRKVTYIGSFQAEQESYCMYIRSFLYKDEIWFIPEDAKKISILNMHNMQIGYISIHADKEKSMKGSKYNNFVKFNNKYVCLVPGCMREAVIINMETKKIENYYNISNQNEEFQSAVFIDNTLRFYPWNGNRKVILNLSSKELNYEEWDGNEKYGDAIYDKISGNIFHAPAKEDHVLIEDIQGELVEKVSIFSSNNEECHTFYSSCYNGEILFWAVQGVQGERGVISFKVREHDIRYYQINVKEMLIPIDSPDKEAFTFGGNKIFYYDEIQKEYIDINIEITFGEFLNQLKKAGKNFYDIYKYMEHEYEIENDPLTLNTFIYLAQSNSSTNNKQDFIQ